MGVKDLTVKPISAKDGNRIIKVLHYSGKVVSNSQIHLGVFLDGKCGGVLQLGPSLDKSKIIGLVKDTKWNEFIELNRMAFADWLPRNSESRAIGYTMRWLKKQYPFLKWVVSFADATQCGDGTIYRASGFVLTGISVSKNLAQLPDGSVIHKMTLESNPTSARKELGGKSYYNITDGKYDFVKYIKAVNGNRLLGYQLRYIYFLDKSYKDKLTVPIIPFSEIKKRGISMYKGKRLKEEASSVQDELGGAVPTQTLQ